ncbi:MAG: Calx-beta domain-containing protein [Pirellulales bacterium]
MRNDSLVQARNRRPRLYARQNLPLGRRLALELLEPRLNMALDVPAFSSLPGANHTIYLDFDGHVTTGTSWNSSYGATSINSPAYSTDADAANFSASELANIERVWRRTAEDFAPFQVNVTTVPPVVDDLLKSGTGDSKWGVRVVVTKDVAFNCGCGGIAYINSFNWNSDTPVYVFNTGEVGVAEAVSHEVGHSLGLAHDGTSSVSYYQGHGSGATSWAPIMGVGYYVSVSQWDNGEYFGANNVGSSANYSKGPDDLAIITTYNGFGYKVDDHGNTLSNASPLAVAGSSVTGSGLITTRSDSDYFQFTTGAGAVTLNINPASLGANLDIAAELYDANGVLVAASNPATALNASFNLNLSAGQYFLKVDGAGVGDPTVSPPSGYSDYASIGQYSISGTLVAVAGDALAIAAADAAKSEGASGSTAFTFTVTRSGDASGTTTVNYAVAGSGSSPASASDFVGGAYPTGALTFAPGELSQTITVDVQGDTTNEGNETFSVGLSNPSSGTSIVTGAATGTILNDDAPPPAPTLAIAAADANKAEGTGTSPTPFVFTVTRAGSTAAAASVRYTVSGTGNRKASGSDFVGGSFPKNVTVNFAVGETSKTIVLNVVADSSRESNETFKVTLSSASGATITTSSANGTILNDDGTAAALLGSNDDAGGSDNDDDESGQADPLIAVADPLWAFIPAELLTPEQLAVPVITWIDGTPQIGDWAHDHDADEDHEHEHEEPTLWSIFGPSSRSIDAALSRTGRTSTLEAPSQEDAFASGLALVGDELSLADSTSLAASFAVLMDDEDADDDELAFQGRSHQDDEALRWRDEALAAWESA